VAFFFFPLIIYCTSWGGYWPLAYVLFTFNMYVLVDNCTPPLTSVQATRVAPLNNAFLFLQIPLAMALFAVYFLKIRLATHGGAPVTLLGLTIAPFGSRAQILAAGFAVGFHSGSNVVVAHELMHRHAHFWKVCSRILLVMTGDAQFQEAHLYGHHSGVGTLGDPASARRGESFYKFLLRSTAGQWKEAYLFESRRLRSRRGAGRILANRVLRGNVASLALLVGVAWFFGPLALAGYLLIATVTKTVLESVNYIQHYGLTREPGSKIEARHSWECDARGSSMYLFNLTRHAEHHSVPRRPFWELQIQPEAHRLPHGYMLAIVVALFPRLWFRYMDRMLGALPANAPLQHSGA